MNFHYDCSTDAYVAALHAAANDITSFGLEPVHRTPICVVAPAERGPGAELSIVSTPDFIGLFRELNKLRDLPWNWNSYGAEPPNERALKMAHTTLVTLMDAALIPEAVVPSVEGGLGFVFRRGQLYADIECLNDGVVLAITSDGTGHPTAWEVSPDSIGIQHAIRRIRAHLAR